MSLVSVDWQPSKSQTNGESAFSRARTSTLCRSCSSFRGDLRRSTWQHTRVRDGRSRACKADRFAFFVSSLRTRRPSAFRDCTGLGKRASMCGRSQRRYTVKQWTQRLGGRTSTTLGPAQRRGQCQLSSNELLPTRKKGRASILFDIYTSSSSSFTDAGAASSAAVAARAALSCAAGFSPPASALPSSACRSSAPSSPSF